MILRKTVRPLCLAPTSHPCRHNSICRGRRFVCLIIRHKGPITSRYLGCVVDESIIRRDVSCHPQSDPQEGQERMLDMQRYVISASLLHILSSASGRKIGCDKLLPGCSNCARTGRVCGGYGLKLHWPESADGRRPLSTWNLKSPHDCEVQDISKYRQVHFLNSSYDEFQCRSLDLHEMKEQGWYPFLSVPTSLRYGYEASSSSDDRALLSYCKSTSHYEPSM